MAKVFGFCGTGCYDLIYYSAKLAHQLGHSALMVDMSNDRELAYLYHDKLKPGEFAEVDGVGLVLAPLSRGSLAGYDYVFVYSGYNTASFKLCHELYFVINYGRNTIERLKAITVPDIPRYLVIRDPGDCAFALDFAINVLPNLDINEEDIYVIEDSTNDAQAKVYLQYSMQVKFSRLSKSIRDLAEHLLDTDVSKKELDKTWKMLQKG